MSRVKVLQVLKELGTGGAERLQVTFAHSVDRDRVDLRVCCLARARETPFARELRRCGIPIDDLDAGRMRDVRSVSRLVSLIRRERIDVVHTHLSTANVVGVVAGALTGRPVVATLHSLSTLRDGHGRVDTLVEDAALRRARLVVAVASEVADDAVRSRRVRRDRLVIVPNAIELDDFAAGRDDEVRGVRRELLGGLGGPLLVAVGAVAGRKSHEVLVRAMPLILAVHPEARAIIVGAPGNNVATVDETVARLRLESNVQRVGARTDVALVLAAADVFVLTSRWEGMPLTIIEAMAAGAPVVAARVGGVTSLVSEGETGLLVPPQDEGALADAVIDALADPVATGARVAAARAMVAADHGAEAWASRLTDHYEELAGRPR